MRRAACLLLALFLVVACGDDGGNDATPTPDGGEGGEGGDNEGADSAATPDLGEALDFEGLDQVLVFAYGSATVDGITYEFGGLGPGIPNVAMTLFRYGDPDNPYIAGCSVFDDQVIADLHPRQRDGTRDSMSIWTTTSSSYMSVYEADEGEEWSARGDVTAETGTGSEYNLDALGPNQVVTRVTFDGDATENFSGRESPASGSMTCYYLPGDDLMLVLAPLLNM